MSISEENNNPEVVARLEAAIEVVEVLTAVPQQVKSTEDMLSFLQERGSYQDKIEYSPNENLHMVNLSARPEGKNLLEPLSPEYVEKLSQLKTAAQAREFLSSELEKVNLTFETIKYKPPLSHDTRHIIRMEFNGFATEQDEDNLSDTYLRLKENAPDKTHQEEEYIQPLEGNASWQEFKKFPRFMKIETDFRKALSSGQIPPEAVSELNSFDFEDILFRYHQKRDQQRGGYREQSKYKMFKDGGAREASIKTYARNHRQELEESFAGMGVEKEVINKTLSAMTNMGQIPAVFLPDKSVMTATVHHVGAIMDADADDITKVNDTDNHVIIFRRQEQNKQEENVATQIRDKDLFKAFQENKILLDGEVDFNAIQSSPEAKQKFVKDLVEKKANELFVAFASMGMDKETCFEVMKPMLRDGKVPEVNLSKNRKLAVSLKRTKRGIKVVFGAQAKESKYSDVHQTIFHAVSNRPVSEEISADKNAERKVMAANEAEDAPGVNKIEVKVKESISKVMYRVKTAVKGGQNMAFIMEGFGDKQVIWSSDKDKADSVARQQQLNREAAGAEVALTLKKQMQENKGI